MKSVDLNLASRPFRNDTPMLVLLGVLAIVAVSLTGYNTYAYMTADARASELRTELADHRGRMAMVERETAQLQGKVGQVPVAQMSTQAQFVAAVLEERNFSWTGLFNELERRVPWNTRLTSIRPTFENDGVAVGLIGVSQDFEAYLDLQTKLGASPRISAVLPSEYQTDKETRRVNFALRFLYDPSALLGETALVADSGAGSAASAGEDEGPATGTRGGREKRGRAAAGTARPGFPQIDDSEAATEAGSTAGAARAAAGGAGAPAPDSPPADGEGADETEPGSREPFGVPDLQGQRRSVAGTAQQGAPTQESETRVREGQKDYDRSRWPIDPFDPRRLGRGLVDTQGNTVDPRSVVPPEGRSVTSSPPPDEADSEGDER